MFYMTIAVAKKQKKNKKTTAYIKSLVCMKRFWYNSNPKYLKAK